MKSQFKITKDPIKILHISTAKSWRGGEQQLAYLYEELDQKGVEQIILCVKDSKMEAYCREKGHQFVSQVKRSGVDPFFAKRIKSICKKIDIDLIHTHDAHGHTYAIIAAALWKNKTPIIVSRRVDFSVGKSKSSFYKYNHSKVAKIVCVSDKIKEITAKDITDQSKLVTVHSGIDLTRFENTHVPGKLKELIGVNDKFLIGNTSALADHKDYFTFIDAAVKLNQKRKDCHFVAIGNGPLEEEIKNYARGKGLANLSFIGFRNDVPEILGDLDVFLITSKTEGLGTSILDAFAQGVPVIATAAGGIPEIVHPEKSGLLCPVFDSECLSVGLDRLLDNAALQQQLIAGAKQILATHTKAATAEKTLAVYRSVLGR